MDKGDSDRTPFKTEFVKRTVAALSQHTNCTITSVNVEEKYPQLCWRKNQLLIKTSVFDKSNITGELFHKQLLKHSVPERAVKLIDQNVKQLQLSLSVVEYVERYNVRLNLGTDLLGMWIGNVEIPIVPDVNADLSIPKRTLKGQLRFAKAVITHLNQLCSALTTTRVIKTYERCLILRTRSIQVHLFNNTDKKEIDHETVGVTIARLIYDFYLLYEPQSVYASFTAKDNSIRVMCSSSVNNQVLILEETV